jgi:hypothetical protein
MSVVPNVESVWPQCIGWCLPPFVLKLSSNRILQQPTFNRKSVKRQHGSPGLKFWRWGFLAMSVIFSVRPLIVPSCRNLSVPNFPSPVSLPRPIITQSFILQ